MKRNSKTLSRLDMLIIVKLNRPSESPNFSLVTPLIVGNILKNNHLAPSSFSAETKRPL